MTKNYPAEAANSGTVAFTGDLGIYGGTVILDHGLGLYSLYGHLSSIDVKAGDAIARRQILGKTGETGLAAGDLGIYGGTVIVDHGLGLYTLYGHLSSIDVKEGDSVDKRQALGKTGETGLAAGDHLHYGVYLAGVAVLPVEWWDQKWIDDNITPKLEGRSGQEIAQAQQPAKAKKAAAKAAPKAATRSPRAGLDWCAWACGAGTGSRRCCPTGPRR